MTILRRYGNCNGVYEWLYQLHDGALKRGLRTVLWGATLDEDELRANPRMQEDMLRYDMIFARETRTYRLASAFHPNVRLFPDPAFTLDTHVLPWPDGAEGAEYIGLNVSSTVISLERKPGITLDACRAAIEFILKETDCRVALIPHVTYQRKFGDYQVLRGLYDLYRHTGRVTLLEDANCSVLKGYISRCRLFITARTHASIAAYSSCVPTLVLGYSAKAVGIAEDLFGNAEGYVLPVQTLRRDDSIAKGFRWLMDNETTTRERLKAVMPGYIAAAQNAAPALKEFCYGETVTA